MTKNEDEKLVTKGAVKKLLDEEILSNNGKPPWIIVEPARLLEAIDKLPACLPAVRQAVSIKSPEEIEKAIEHLENKVKNSWSAALLRWVLNQEQEVWNEEQIFGKPSGKVNQ